MLRALFAAVIVTSPSVALAYNVSTTSGGQPLHWPDGEIRLELAMAEGPATVSPEEAEAAAIAAAASWENALAGTDVELATAEEDGAAPTVSGDGVPSVRWAVDQTDPAVDVGRLALTEVSYRISDGLILDADVVVNAATELQWTVSPDSCGDAYDLEGTLGHEFGHLLGLGHSADREATMFATAAKCETLKRDLSPDDVAGIDYLYGGVPAPSGGGGGGGGEGEGEGEGGEDLAADRDIAMPVGCSTTGSSGGLPALLVLAALLGLAGRRIAGRARAAWAVIAVAVLGWAAPASAAELRRVELGELGAHAGLVVRGVVVATRPVIDGALATDSEVRVVECLAGDCPDTVHVRRRGGERAGRGLLVDGEAELRPGEEVILYLQPRPDRLLRVIGGVQGVLRVVRRGDEVHAVRDLRGHRVLAGGQWQQGAVERIELAAVRGSIAR
jgi:MYXO-CTERM domain-containing protein